LAIFPTFPENVNQEI